MEKKKVDPGVTKGLLGSSGLGVRWGLLRLRVEPGPSGAARAGDVTHHLTGRRASFSVSHWLPCVRVATPLAEDRVPHLQGRTPPEPAWPVP